MPDTQHYVDDRRSYGQLHRQTQWIVDNDDDLNIVFASHLGDIVENVDTSNEIEWPGRTPRWTSSTRRRPKSVVARQPRHEHERRGENFSTSTSR